MNITYYNIGTDEKMPITQDIVDDFQTSINKLAIVRDVISKICKLKISDDKEFNKIIQIRKILVEL